MEKVIIHESIKEGTSLQNCSLCANWGADVETRNGKRKAHGFIRKSGQIVKECKIHGHIAVPSCVCSSYSMDRPTPEAPGQRKHFFGSGDTLCKEIPGAI